MQKNLEQQTALADERYPYDIKSACDIHRSQYAITKKAPNNNRVKKRKINKRKMKAKTKMVL